MKKKKKREKIEKNIKAYLLQIEIFKKITRFFTKFYIINIDKSFGQRFTDSTCILDASTFRGRLIFSKNKKMQRLKPMIKKKNDNPTLLICEC